MCGTNQRGFDPTGGNMRRHPTFSVAVAAITCLTMATVLGPGVASAVPGVRFVLGPASPTSLGPAGGTVTLSAIVSLTNGTTCTFSANRPVPGLPASVPCTNGTVVENVSVPANGGKRPVDYTFKMTITGSGTKKVGMTVVGSVKCSHLGKKADLAGCDLDGASAPNSKLENAYLADANLTDANLANANLAGANLAGANLTGANLSDAVLGYVTSGGISGVPEALPTGTSLVNGYLVGPGALLMGADLSGADLTGTDLTYSNLINADLSDVDLSGVDMQAADLGGANLTGANLNSASLIGTSLSTADFTDADFTDASLAGTDLRDAELSGATLTGVGSGLIEGSPSSLPANWSLTVGFLVGPGANLNDANLTDADLSGVDLTDADLSDVVSGGITGTPSALPTDWSLTDGYLIGPTADLYYANLSGAELANADLTGATMDNTNLSDADLTGADLSGAIVTSRTDLTGVTWSDTTCPDGTNSDNDGSTCVNNLG
jgi:uncharacterized protein YjbI with pentapeptide repeats